MNPTTPPAATPSTDLPMVVNCVAYRNNGTRIGEVTIDAISEVLAEPDTFVWVGLYEPDETLLGKIQDEFGLHDLAIEDAHAAHQRTKLETYGDSLFLVVQTAQLVNGELAFGETHIFFGPRYLVTVRHGASQSYAPARRGCEQTPELLANGPSYGLYAVLDFIVDNLLPIVRDFREEVQQLEHDIFGETYKSSTVRRLYDMQRDLMTLRLAVAPLQDIVNQLIRLHPNLIPEVLQAYFRDVYDHAFRVNEAIGAMREMLTAAINVNLSLVSLRQNEVMKKLAGWAAMLAAPTLLTSWYGMNFTHMPELAQPWAYPGIIVVVGGVVGGIYLGLKRAKWL
ncbi:MULTISPECIES: magnesium and cobalt transport protein CorA [Rhodanobacter]|uniref:magnesium and cobalt transport protein CorA n=2 Tax=Rhodanobacteraceae TaxID=1775411 RepID=UPI00091E53D6|nr:magnesium and cobalt transport protein CorA [Rhodanobacter thiooxydans]TAN16726.1 MAG: magnesium and cobalt transport protein CorA [Rhodanobacter sp.]UJJ54225.1 magnesium and cobalt transport protein CorA [Rhodanobacter thiooxydans]